jgi:hypothetical protein
MLWLTVPSLQYAGTRSSGDDNSGPEDETIVEPDQGNGKSEPV